MRKDLAQEARSAAPNLVEWRRYLHMHPEISFQEHETTEWLARKMEEFGISYSRPTPTGLVGLVEGIRPGRTIAVRADIDALPIEEQNHFDFRSQRSGAMHACGHDGHTAILLGLARFLSRNRNFAGRIKLLFQPAEEAAPGGAIAFVKAGVLDDVDACIGLHLISDIPTGQAAILAGPVMAGGDGIQITIQGRGGHGAQPHKAIDAVMVACNAVVNLQTVVSRKIDPTRPAVLSIGSIHAGNAGNVLADQAEMTGTLRYFHDDVRQTLRQEITRTLESTCAMYGASATTQFIDGYPPVVNHPQITAVMRESATEVLGAGTVSDSDLVMGSEDFAHYCKKVPAAFLFVGCGSPQSDSQWAHHHPRFTIDEAALPHGVEILGRAALRLLAE